MKTCLLDFLQNDAIAEWFSFTSYLSDRFFWFCSENVTVCSELYSVDQSDVKHLYETENNTVKLWLDVNSAYL